MFFHIADHPQPNYPCHWHMGSFCVSTDQGWQLEQVGTAQVLYKGYADRAELHLLLMDIVLQTTPHILGNFCALVLIDNNISIQTDRYRSFPIYIADHSVNNLIKSEHIAWTDSLVTVHADLAVTETKFDLIGKIKDYESTVDEIDHLLLTKISQFVSHNQLPLRVFLSGGVDTLLVYSYLKRLNATHELIWNNHVDYDDFWLANSGSIQANWGYTQIHHWQQPCVLVSGAPGDEFMLRSPITANLYLMRNGTNIPELLHTNSNCLHYQYFSLPKHTEIFARQTSTTTTNWDLCNIVANDWQHWHLGNTFTYTPLRDLELFKLFLQLPTDLAKSQIMHSEVSRLLIERNVPGLSMAISDQKNTGNFLRNLRQLRRTYPG